MQTSTLYLHATIIWSPIIIELGLYSANIVSYRLKSISFSMQRKSKSKVLDAKSLHV